MEKALEIRTTPCSDPFRSGCPTATGLPWSELPRSQCQCRIQYAICLLVLGVLLSFLTPFQTLSKRQKQKPSSEKLQKINRSQKRKNPDPWKQLHRKLKNLNCIHSNAISFQFKITTSRTRSQTATLKIESDVFIRSPIQQILIGKLLGVRNPETKAIPCSQGNKM